MRRAIIIGAVALQLVACSSDGGGDANATRTPAVSAALSSTQAERVATEAYLWGYPLIASARTYRKLGSLIGVNSLFWQDRLSDISTRVIVAPNQDTLYSVAVLDLRNGPLMLTVPDVHDRYWTYEMLDFWTEAFAYIGTRATAGNGGSFLLTTADWRGTVPAGAKRIISQTPQMFLLGRFLIADSSDIPAVQAIRAQVSLAPLNAGGRKANAPTARAADDTPIADLGAGFVEELNDALAINPPTRSEEIARMNAFAVVGVGADTPESSLSQDIAREKAIGRGPSRGEARLAQFQKARLLAARGWMIDREGGRYRNNTVRRAFVSKVGWGENRPEEAIYPFTTIDADGKPLDGAHRYVLHFDKNELPAVKAFWSLTLYGPDHFFTANDINRYAIGDRTPGLTYNPDGSLDLLIQHENPANEPNPEYPNAIQNWLPAPQGPFNLMLRLYLPEPSVIDGTTPVPAVRMRAER